jgi:drug/metabolite transporter (DMT)-like permease
MLFTAAVQNTAVANVLVIVASNTVFSSIFSYLLLGELIPIRMFVTSAICFGAIALIFSGNHHPWIAHCKADIDCYYRILCIIRLNSCLVLPTRASSYCIGGRRILLYFVE